jgi:hypothetical protein
LPTQWHCSDCVSELQFASTTEAIFLPESQNGNAESAGKLHIEDSETKNERVTEYLVPAALKRMTALYIDPHGTMKA